MITLFSPPTPEDHVKAIFLRILLKIEKKKDGYMYLITVPRKLFIKISLVFYCYFYTCNVVIFQYGWVVSHSNKLRVARCMVPLNVMS